MGVTKDRLRVDGAPILQHLLRRFRMCLVTRDWPTMVVTSPEQKHPDGVDGFDTVAWDDAPALGPLAGTATALSAAGTELVAVLAIDAPWIEPAYVAWLVDELLTRPSISGLCGRRGKIAASTDYDGIEVLPAVFRRNALGTLHAQLSANRRSLRGLLVKPNFLAVELAREWPAQHWHNLNRPDDLEKDGVAIQ